MKSLKVVLVVAMFSLFSVAAQAQTQNLGQQVSGLVALAVGLQTGDITLEDIQVVNIEDVDIDVELRNIDVTILERVILRNVNIQVLSNILGGTIVGIDRLGRVILL